MRITRDSTQSTKYSIFAMEDLLVTSHVQFVGEGPTLEFKNQGPILIPNNETLLWIESGTIEISGNGYITTDLNSDELYFKPSCHDDDCSILLGGTGARPTHVSQFV